MSFCVRQEFLTGLGLDHGQIAGRGKNILVRNDLAVIIDFEKASQVRKCNNENKVKSFLFKSPHSAIVKKVKKILSA
jgi:predicted Ser/Thr protein kinase